MTMSRTVYAHCLVIHIDRQLKSKSYPKSIREDNIFLPCRHVLEGKTRKLRSEGKGSHRAHSLNAEEKERLYHEIGPAE